MGVVGAADRPPPREPSCGSARGLASRGFRQDERPQAPRGAARGDGHGLLADGGSPPRNESLEGEFLTDESNGVQHFLPYR